jgi:trimeric autotransporter adhesin
MANKAQLIASSSQTYFENQNGSITPASVNSFNTTWINSTVLNDNSASFVVSASAVASTITFLRGDNTTFNVTIAQSGSVESASYAAFADNARSSSYAFTASSATNAFTSVSSSFAETSVSASFVLSASFANSASRAISAESATSSSYADNANTSNTSISASYALTASFALNAPTVDTGSFVTTSSFNAASSSLSTRVTNLESFSSSLDATFATDAQLNAATQSLSASTSTVNTRVTEVSGSLLQVSASYIALSASYNVSSGSESARTTRLESTASALVAASGSFSTRVTNTEVSSSNLVAASASFSTRVSDNTSNIQTLTSATASYAVLANNQTFTGKNTFNNDVTASNVRITGTASIAFLDVTFQSSSVIYSSGSNQFGDASNDTQTLYGTVNVVTGPLVVTGSANFKETITGSISGNAAFATNAEFAVSASLAQFAAIASAALTASYAYTASSAEKAFQAVSSSYAFTASSAVNAANAISASFATTASFVTGTVASASFATSASRAISAASATSSSFATSASRALSADSSTTSLSGSSVLVDNYNGINSTYYLTMVDNASGYKRLGLDTDLSYNPSTNVLSATVQSAATASSITIDNYNGSNTTYYLTMVDNAAGAKRVGLDTDLSYNPSTNLLTGLITSASFATSASRAISTETATSASFATSASRAISALSSSYSLTSSFADNANQANSANTATSASYAFTASSAISASFASVAATVLGTITSASYAFTASSAVNATNALTASSLTTLNQTVTITGSVNVSGSIRISQGDDLITHHVQAAAVNGVEIQNNSGNVVALFGAGGSQGTTFNGQVNGTAFSGSGAQIFGVVSSSFAQNAATASVLLGAVVSSSYAFTASSAEKAFEAVSSSYALTASFALNGGGGAAFPFTGSAGITGSLNVVGPLYVPSGSIEITGSATIVSGSLTLFSYKVSPSVNILNKTIEQCLIQPLNATNNIISVSTTGVASTGSIIISGSGNYVSLSTLAQNSAITNGSTVGFNGTNAYVTTMPTITGSNPNFNTVTDRNNRRVPAISNSNVNAAITINDNRGSESSVPVTISNSSVNMAPTITVNSGSLTISATQLLGSATTFIVSGSGTNASNASITQNIFATAGGTVITFNATSSQASTLTSNLLVGNNIRVSLTGSSSQNSTASPSPSLIDSAIIGRHLIVTGSSNSGTTTANIAVFGAHNTADGLLNDGRFTKFAIGTGASDASRTTAFHVSASGMTTANVGLNVRGIETGATELEVRTTGVKIGNLITDAHNLTGSFAISGSQVITGSLYTNQFIVSGSQTITGSLIGQPVSQSVSSNTASLDLTSGNFFNLTLPASTNTYITASGQVDGQTVNIKVTQGATVGTLSFGAGFKQASGSFYTGSQVANAVDIVTLISFDNTGIYVSNVNNLI